jgi:hypothetical protein
VPKMRRTVRFFHVQYASLPFKPPLPVLFYAQLFPKSCAFDASCPTRCVLLCLERRRTVRTHQNQHASSLSKSPLPLLSYTRLFLKSCAFDASCTQDASKPSSVNGMYCLTLPSKPLLPALSFTQVFPQVLVRRILLPSVRC